MPLTIGSKVLAETDLLSMECTIVAGYDPNFEDCYTKVEGSEVNPDAVIWVIDDEGERLQLASWNWTFEVMEYDEYTISVSCLMALEEVCDMVWAYGAA